MALPDTHHAYSVEDAARALSISRRSAYRLIANGQLLTVKLGGRRLVPMREIERLLGPASATPGEGFVGRGCEPVAAPEDPQAPAEQPERVKLSELLAKVASGSSAR